MTIFLSFSSEIWVPNAPCGVESRTLFVCGFTPRMFLMHRVELKVFNPMQITRKVNRFLMHRVELKGVFIMLAIVVFMIVPNAPCGVESHREIKLLKDKMLVPNAPCGVESVTYRSVYFSIKACS